MHGKLQDGAMLGTWIQGDVTELHHSFEEQTRKSNQDHLIYQGVCDKIIETCLWKMMYHINKTVAFGDIGIFSIQLDLLKS